MPKTVTEIPECVGCPVLEKFPASTFIQPLLVPGNRIAVAEAGGANEALEGTPLVGASGSWLRGKELEDGKRTGGLYRAAGVDPNTVSLCNVLNCSIAADHKNIFPLAVEARQYISKEDAEAAVRHCVKNHVEPILTSRSWTRIDLLGDRALQALTGKTGGITRWRGSPLAVPATGSEKPVAVPTLHPAYLARQQELLPAVVVDLKKTTDTPDEQYDTTPSLETVKAFVATEFAADIETIWGRNVITMVGLCSKSGHAICVPFVGVYIDELKRIFSTARTIVGHNILQFDQPQLEAAGVRFPKDCYVFDTMLAQHLLQPDLPHGLDFLGSYFTNKPAWKHLSGEDEALYCCRDVDVTWQCYLQLRPMLRAEKLLSLYENVQVPLARICHNLHETGVRINPARLKEVRADLEARSEKLEEELPAELKTREVPIRKREKAPEGTVSEKTGKPLKYVMVDSFETVSPWKSSDELQRYLYETCKLPTQTHVKTGQPSTDKTALPKLIKAANSPAYRKENGVERAEEIVRGLRSLQKIRQLASLLSTFVQDKWESSGVERIHTSFNAHGTASGRLSSSDPNLQNIPKSVRCIYVPTYEDWVVVNVDFASLENRLTALYANDYERLDRLAQKGYSEHKHNASILFDIPYDEVIKDDAGDSPYTKAKKVTHGLNYGEGPLKIARINDLDFYEVKTLCEKWKAANPKTIQWQQATYAQAKADGFLTTKFGRKRWFYGSNVYTECLSFLPQSSGADIIIRCMIGLLYERLGWPESRVQKILQVYHPLPQPARLLLTVHDSLVLEAPISMEAEIRAVLKKVLEQAWPEFGGYSFPVEIGTGPSWGETR